MSAKNTQKRVAAVNALILEGSRMNQLQRKDSEALYSALESLGYWWDSSAGEWKKGKPPSTSMFKDDEGEPTGVIRLRLMGHPDDMPVAIEAARRCYKVSDVSDHYSNRKGPGVRVYITALLKEEI